MIIPNQLSLEALTSEEGDFICAGWPDANRTLQSAEELGSDIASRLRAEIAIHEAAIVELRAQLHRVEQRVS